MNNKLINSLLYTLLTFSIGKLLIGHHLNTFLHPKMFKYVTFLFIGLLIICLYQWVQWFQDRKTDRIRLHFGILPFLLLFLGIMINPQNLQAENKSANYTSLSYAEQPQSEDQTPKESKVALESASVNEENQSSDGLSEESGTAVEPSEVTTEDGALLSEDNDTFLEVLTDLHENPEAFMGKSIELEGFVYRQEDFNNNAFVVGRLLITCCAADASVIGIYIEGENANQFENDTWVHIKGTVSEAQLGDGDQEESIILNQCEIRQIEPYTSSYVYFQ